MRLIHAVRDLNAERGHAERIETVALFTEGERTAMFVREADLSYSLGPASERPYINHGVLETRPRRDRRRRRLGRLGLRRRGPGVRRGLRAHRRHLHRPEPGGDAQARGQDRLEAHRRGGRRPGGAVEPGPGGHARGGHRRGPRHRLSPDAQGHGGRRRPRHPGGGFRRRPQGRLRAHPRRGAARVRQRRGLPRAPGHRRAPRRGAGDRRRPGHGLGGRRARLLGAASQPEGHRGVRLPGAQRRRRSTSSRPAPSGSPSPWGTPGPAPWSSSTTRARSSSPSWRSTPGCRSSTPSPRSRPTSTWSSCRSTLPPAVASRVSARPSPATPSRPGSTPRTPTATSRRRPAGSPCSACPRAPASGWTPAWGRATRSLPTSTR